MEHNAITSDLALTKKPSATLPDPIDQEVLEEAARAGVLYGKRKSRTNPRMKQYIYTTRNGVEVFDFPQTLEYLEKALVFLKNAVAEQKQILIVGSTPPAKQFVRELAEAHSYPYVVERWLGGTLTNYPTISKRVGYYLGLKADRAAGKFDIYTKKERVALDKNIEKMDRLFGGLEKLTSYPQVLIVINPQFHAIAVREANQRGVPVVALISSDGNPDVIQYPIPANDHARNSIQWFLGHIKKAFKEGMILRAQQQAEAEKAVASQEKARSDV
ncbi:MAG: 30S ribosomal protein S2 [Candidatus Harrisonbacteria bacterium CG10_big_fil_rev_8_21_14_0_10_42_17]|uniref:Small ribosomal subunit protein uS2 n=1 Tax=Candidatus Harrisonbacteria bacterium CG10_big_fil_rev_8_21_14_0_10_42_17 TaxID=1974584 RepID=A0A2M6WJ36_9BACT|nr:MAG: 30S ribosomal protein S2 [Candidatus Harrisonbacteria bacterium CG10_big_fil_rev_8_21_14_0_10_42_17]